MRYCEGLESVPTTDWKESCLLLKTLCMEAGKLRCTPRLVASLPGTETFPLFREFGVKGSFAKFFQSPHPLKFEVSSLSRHLESGEMYVSTHAPPKSTFHAHSSPHFQMSFNFS